MKEREALKTIGLIFIILLNFGGADLSAQIDYNSTGSGEIYVHTVRLDPENPNSLEGDFYETESEVLTDIEFVDGNEIVDIPTKFNLERQNLEQRVDDKLMIYAGAIMESFKQEGRTYIVGRQISNTLIHDKFYCKLADGPFQLYSLSHVALRENAYNAALDIGKKGFTYVKTTEYILMENEKTVDHAQSIKKIIKTINKNSACKKIYKSEKLKPSEEHAVQLLTACYN